MAEPAFLRPEQKFHPDPARSYTLPARYYTDPAVLGLERTEIFFKNWLYVCHREKLAKPGDYVTASIFEQNIALIKGKDGQVRAFYNVCSHRAHQLLAGEGTVRAKTVTCPYHAWAYLFSPGVWWYRLYLSIVTRGTMGQVLHGSAKTTHAIRAAIQRSQASIKELSERYDLNPKTVAKWKKRDFIDDAPMGPKDVHSTVLSVEEEALAVAFRKHTLLPLDDCLYALQATIPQLTRSSLHRCLQRHGMSRLPDMAGDRPKKRFKTYPIGYFHIDIAEVRTEEGRLYLFVAVDRTSKFAHAELREKATRKIAAAFLQTLIEIVPYRVHTVLTDNGIQFTDLPGNRTGPTARYSVHLFDRVCNEHGIEHRLTKPNHPWINGQVERMNRTLKEATVKKYHYETHQNLRDHLQTFLMAYNFAKRLKTLKGLTSYEFICKCWTEEPKKFRLNPMHHTPGLNTYHLDGRVRSARGSEKVAGFAADEFCLCQVRVEEFCNFVFVNLDPDAASLASTTGDLEAQIRRYVPDLDGLTKAAECGFELEANKMVVVENFNECYHCPGAHPALASLLDMETYKIETESLVATHRSRTRQGANKAYDYQAGGEEALENGIFFVLWPNLMIWVMPGRSNIGLVQCNPSAPGHTVERFDLFLPDATPNGQEQAYADYFRDVLNPEDISLVENVQRGLHQMGYNQGRFMVDAERTDMSEHAVHHFQTLVHEALGEFDWRTRASRRRSYRGEGHNE